jgi:hypothetical protein
VEITNNSASGEDENLTAISDSKFDGITGTHPAQNGFEAVTGTTCGVATGAAGAGTASDLTGAGTLPATIANNGSYKCYFDGQICTAGSHTNQITASLTGVSSGQSITWPAAGNEAAGQATITVNQVTGTGLCPTP